MRRVVEDGWTCEGHRGRSLRCSAAVLVRIALIDDVVVMDLQGADGTADWWKYLLITDAGEGHVIAM